MYIMLAFFEHFSEATSIEHYSTILVAFFRKINIFFTECRNKNYFLRENED